MNVIDIGDWSENLNWEKIAKENRGVIIKISEGRTPASLFKTHVRNAKRHGLQWGVYCLSHATHSERAEAEAEAVLDILEDLGTPPLFVWYDIEPELSDRLSPEELTQVAGAFVYTINDAIGDCGIYGNYTTLNKLNTHDLADYIPYWVSEPNEPYCFFKVENPHLNVKVWQKEFDSVEYGDTVDKNEWWED